MRIGNNYPANAALTREEYLRKQEEREPSGVRNLRRVGGTDIAGRAEKLS